ncbi:6-bladed beta-propeller [Labilibaculum sp. DW002]|uniref:6-bladed beta-propeller n=1 Tax=Paralabilibaculum antarcticum TaxID=2912572 RepID=A0ABT5VRS0_9BACT|nr:6-bladed beta-propeller [Labilibaculum sp. DW002]MDE5417930.1 6-bladed beta-propeller [Labilibaculum sp. DW002]
MEKLSLKRDTSFYKLSDSTYFSDVRGIVASNNKFYFTDYKRNQILILNKDLKLIRTLGSGGKGPGEFIGAAHITIFQDTLYILNDGKQSIEVYDKNKYISTIKPTISSAYLPNTSFVKNKNGLYLSNVSMGTSIVKLSSLGKIKKIGLVQQYRTKKETYVKNKKHLLNNKENIIAVSDNKLNIEIYNSEGVILNKLNFENIAILKDRMTLINKETPRENGYYELISYAYIFNDKLYLLLTTNKGVKVNTNNILEIKINNNNFEITRILSLGKGWFTSFCVTENQILAYDGQNGEMVKFKLN